MKVWKEASEISMIHELPDKKLRELDREMRKKPNFDKGSTNNAGKCKVKKKSIIKGKRKDY